MKPAGREGIPAGSPSGESTPRGYAASKVHEEMTGTLLQFKAPEGTDELEIPKEPAGPVVPSEKAKSNRHPIEEDQIRDVGPPTNHNEWV